MNMFKPNQATTVQEYLQAIPPERKELFEALHQLIKKTVPEFPPFFANNMIGYGSFEYINYKKEQIQWPIIALANQKNYVSVYVCSVHNGKYVAEQLEPDLGKVSVGKSCIRIKKLADVHLPTLKKAIELAAANPGL